MLFKNVIIAILSVILMMQSNYFRPRGGIQMLLLPIIWYFVVAGTLTWIDLQRLAKKERDRNEEDDFNSKEK